VPVQRRMVVVSNIVNTHDVGDGCSETWSVGVINFAGHFDSILVSASLAEQLSELELLGLRRAQIVCKLL